MIRRHICMCMNPRWVQELSGEGYCQNCDNVVTEWMFILEEEESQVDWTGSP